MIAKVASPRDTVKLDEGPLGYERDDKLGQWVPTDPKERAEWMAEYEKLKAPPPPPSAAEATPAPSPAAEQGASSTPATPFTLTDPTAMFDASKPMSSARRKQRRAYKVQGFSGGGNTIASPSTGVLAPPMMAPSPSATNAPKIFVPAPVPMDPEE